MRKKVNISRISLNNLRLLLEKTQIILTPCVHPKIS